MDCWGYVPIVALSASMSAANRSSVVSVKVTPGFSDANSHDHRTRLRVIAHKRVMSMTDLLRPGGVAASVVRLR